MPDQVIVDASGIASLLEQIRFTDSGLVAAIAQQHGTGEVLMMAWMNREAVTRTLETGKVHYYSRSRKALWRKGETSGQEQRLCDLLIDCDGDTLLLMVAQDGVACHTGHHNCFFRAPRANRMTDIHPVVVSPETLYQGRD